jgi:hypothetical protein
MADRGRRAKVAKPRAARAHSAFLATEKAQGEPGSGDNQSPNPAVATAATRTKGSFLTGNAHRGGFLLRTVGVIAAPRHHPVSALTNHPVNMDLEVQTLVEILRPDQQKINRKVLVAVVT